MVALKPGLRLRSQVDETEIMVIRPSATVELTIGGVPAIAVTDEPDASLSIADGFDTGATLGKRYTAESDSGLEVLVTKAGKGTLADGTTPLVLKEAKPLPSSD